VVCWMIASEGVHGGDVEQVVSVPVVRTSRSRAESAGKVPRYPTAYQCREQKRESGLIWVAESKSEAHAPT
jgi:hypothetical protein